MQAWPEGRGGGGGGDEMRTGYWHFTATLLAQCLVCISNVAISWDMVIFCDCE